MTESTVHTARCELQLAVPGLRAAITARAAWPGIMQAAMPGACAASRNAISATRNNYGLLARVFFPTDTGAANATLTGIAYLRQCHFVQRRKLLEIAGTSG